MQIKLFTIPIIGGEKLEAELNAFIRSKKILQTERELVNNPQGAFWCFCITYLDGGRSNVNTSVFSRKEKPDYKKILDEAAFQRFSRFREIRKTVAEEDAVPAYAVFTNAELAEIAKLGEKASLADVRKVPGIGKRKLEKYGHHFINQDEASK